MHTYLIDGNNLIGKIRELWQLQSKDKQSAREKLAFKIDRFFTGKNVSIKIVFDGYPNSAIHTSKSSILYSENKTADEIIKKRIEESKNSKNLIVISSDRNLSDFAKKCSCQVISSENFSKELTKQNKNEEEEKRKSISDDEIKKLFGV